MPAIGAWLDRAIMNAWWSGDVSLLRAIDAESIIGTLSTRLVEAHPLNRATQVVAWRAQVALLKDALSAAPGHWRILLEYPLLRLGRRIDAVLLMDHAIVVIEFKIGAMSITNTDRQQVDDYALDLRDFHAGSRHHPIVPVLVATEARPLDPVWPLIWHGAIGSVIETNATGMASVLKELGERVPVASTAIDIPAWEGMPYRPVPTIVEAARMLFRRHGVADIAASRADVTNLGRTTDAILEAVRHARATDSHVVVFVTGIPGAGKTLCGLNAVFAPDANAAFLTGNIPLVHVLRRALVLDAVEQGRNRRAAEQEIEAAVQPLMGFLRDNLERSEPPHEHVIVFDEAQRAWDAAFGRQKFDRDDSEAGLFLDIMGRHKDWAVIIALVGGGQEINTGEAGLQSWGESLSARPHWQTRAPTRVLTATDPRQLLFDGAPPGLGLDDHLHLSVPVRSIRSDAGAPWVDAVLAGDADTARRIAEKAGGVPFVLTRSLDSLRRTLRQRTRGTRRAGLVCSAKAKRLRADGIWPEFPHLDADIVSNWFLLNWPDVRASDALEVPATQFACQGLELDYVGLCWGNDLIRAPGQQAWTARAFVGKAWQIVRAEAKYAYQINTYRVLLTRARYDTVIWVPEGDARDRTRDPADFDGIAAFFLRCGATLLVEEPQEALAEVSAMLL